MFDLAALHALNQLLADAAWARQRLAPFAGHRARISLSLPAFHLEFRIATDGTLESLGRGEPDVEIVLAADAPFAALGGRQALTRGARVSGAADFAEVLGLVLRNLEWDFEALLSRRVGDIAAHRLAAAARGLAAAHKETAKRLTENLTEYLLFERPLWPQKRAAAAFAVTVAKTQADAHALTQRIARLERGSPV